MQIVANTKQYKHNKQQPSASVYLFEICKLMQREILDERGITLWVDFNSGTLSAWRCKIVGQIAQALIEDICRDQKLNARGGTISVTLQNTGQVWVLAVTDKGIRTYHQSLLLDRPSPVEELALPPKANCRTRLQPDGATNVVLFNSKPWWSNANDLVTLILPELHPTVTQHRIPHIPALLESPRQLLR